MSTKTFKFQFDGTNPLWSDAPEHNRLMLEGVRNHMHDMLRAKGHLLLNDVLAVLDLPPTREGLTMGWTDPSFLLLRFEEKGTTFIIEAEVTDIAEAFHTYEEDEPEEVDEEYTAVAVYADWQVFGDEDLDVAEHLEHLIDEAQENGHTLRDFSITSTGGIGLCYIHFSVIVDVAMDQIHDSNELRTVVKQYLDFIVHDTEVSVRWAQVIG